IVHDCPSLSRILSPPSWRTQNARQRATPSARPAGKGRPDTSVVVPDGSVPPAPPGEATLFPEFIAILLEGRPAGPRLGTGVQPPAGRQGLPAFGAVLLAGGDGLQIPVGQLRRNVARVVVRGERGALPVDVFGHRRTFWNGELDFAGGIE